MAKDNNEKIIKAFDKYAKETRRHFDVVAESIKDEIKILGEQVAANTEKLEEHDERFDAIDQRFEKVDERFISIDERFEKIDEDLTIIKVDLGTIKNELKQKVSRDEFAILEKRVSLLEARSR